MLFWERAVQIVKALQEDDEIEKNKESKKQFLHFARSLEQSE